MNGLLELAAECEIIVGPSRELDLAIDCEVRPREWSSKVRETRNPGHPVDYFDEDELPRYTASLDAAMQLVPESDETRAVFWRLGNDGEGGNPGDFKAEVLVASTYSAKTFCGLADTAPLALCAAALRARGEEVAK